VLKHKGSPATKKEPMMHESGHWGRKTYEKEKMTDNREKKFKCSKKKRRAKKGDRTKSRKIDCRERKNIKAGGD